MVQLEVEIITVILTSLSQDNLAALITQFTVNTTVPSSIPCIPIIWLDNCKDGDKNKSWEPHKNPTIKTLVANKETIRFFNCQFQVMYGHWLLRCDNRNIVNIFGQDNTFCAQGNRESLSGIPKQSKMNMITPCLTHLYGEPGHLNWMSESYG